MLPFDLHVLSMPPAFNLSHDQTLQFNVIPDSPLFRLPSVYLESTCAFIAPAEILAYPAKTPSTSAHITWSTILLKIARSARQQGSEIMKYTTRPVNPCMFFPSLFQPAILILSP